MHWKNELVLINHISRYGWHVLFVVQVSIHILLGNIWSGNNKRSFAKTQDMCTTTYIFDKWRR